MMRTFVIIVLLGTMFAACKEKYDLPYSGPAKGYLVIDGIINSGQGPTTLRLTRTLALVDSVAFRFEEGANVRIEGDDNSTHPLTELTGGQYHSPQLILNQTVKYRLHINTSNGKEYLSDYAPVLKTPAIDSLPWEKNDEGVTIFVNTGDPQNKTLYYRWEYEETWEFRSPLYSLIKYEYNSLGSPFDVDPRDGLESSQMYTCYSGGLSTNLLLGTSAKLSRDTIHLPLLLIPNGSWKIGVLYSIKVKQYAVSKGGYEFLQRMKKNTEQVGSLFDAQPSELVGNVRCVTDPTEIVIGYADIADAQEKRIFIRRNEVQPWNYSNICVEENIPNHPDSLAAFGSYIPTTVAAYSQNGDTVRVFVALPNCVDCRLRGTPLKPSFWP